MGLLDENPDEAMRLFLAGDYSKLSDDELAVLRDAAADANAHSPHPIVEQTERFGLEVPRTSPTQPRTFKVDFRAFASMTVRITLNKDAIYFIWTETNEKGESCEKAEWRQVSLAMQIVHAKWMVADVLPKKSLSATMGSEVAAVVCVMWLRSRGKFFWDESAKGFLTSLYYDEKKGVLMRVRSDEFAAFVSTASEINRESTGFKYLMALIDDAAMDESVACGVIPSVMWDRRGDSVYVSSGDSEMYRLRDGNVEKVNNGTDGVLFVRGKTLAPWNLVTGPGVDPFEHASIFTGASWADKTGLMNARLWFLNLFYCHQTKPILLISGIHQSGKTRMAKGIKEILGVRVEGRPDYSVLNIKDGDKGEEAFWVCLNEGKIEVFDNVDTKIKWVGNAFQTAATDGQIKQRTLYTNTGMTILRANANMILTSNNPLFTTEGEGGMADRIITLNLMTRTLTKDVELSDEIRQHRDEYLTWAVRTVAVALADRTPVDKSINTRHPDYGAFSVRCGRAFGDEPGVLNALGAAEADKCLLPLRNDAVTREILAVLKDNGYHFKFTSGEMSAAIVARIGEDADEKTRTFFSSRKVGRALSIYGQQLEKLFQWCAPRMLGGKMVYQTTGLTALGSLQLSTESLEGGLGGLKGAFSTSHVDEKSSTRFIQNTLFNPPNPPISSEEEEESEKNNMEGGIFDGSDF